MRFDIDLDGFLSEEFQLRDELSDLGETVSNERLTTVLSDALPDDIYSTIKVQSRDRDLEVKKNISIMKPIFINHSERLSVPKRSQDLCRKGRNSGREPTMNGQKSAITTVINCYSC